MNIQLKLIHKLTLRIGNVKEEWKSTKSFYDLFLGRKAQRPARIETVCLKNQGHVGPWNRPKPAWTEICCSMASATTAATPAQP